MSYITHNGDDDKHVSVEDADRRRKLGLCFDGDLRMCSSSELIAIIEEERKLRKDGFYIDANHFLEIVKNSVDEVLERMNKGNN